MSLLPRLEHYPRHLSFISRRRILIEKHRDKSRHWIQVDLEDQQHALQLRLEHADGVITDVQAHTHRVPFTTCNGATEVIEALKGFALEQGAAGLRQHSQPKHNCTHLYDMALLAIAHAPRTENRRQYDITVPNCFDRPAWVSIERNGELVHRWQIAAGSHFEDKIVAPEALIDRPIFRGFFDWIRQRYDADGQEAALMLQKGYLVSPTRNHDYDYTPNRLAHEDTGNHGVCFTYTSPRLETARLIPHSQIDFSDCPEALLSFR